MLPAALVTLGVFEKPSRFPCIDATSSAPGNGGKMAAMAELNRRAALRLSAGAAVGAAGALALNGLLTPQIASGAPPAPPAPLEPVTTDSSVQPTMLTGSFVSATRGGVTTNWAIARPPGQTQPLRPLIALHGKGGDAATVMAGGVERGLAQAIAAGLPPFAVVSVDGGGSYWHKRASGEDSGAMVLDELIPLLDAQGLDTSRVAFLGWSMGGYGALLLGARLGAARTAAIAAVSPALWLSSAASAPGAFDGADDFTANSVFGLPALASIPIRIDIGTSDPFYTATQEFIAQLPHRPAGGSGPGGHDADYWSSQLSGELDWIAPLLTA